MEHTTLAQIMVRNGGKIKFPLWKLHVQEQEYLDLKDTLSAAYIRGNLLFFTQNGGVENITEGLQVKRELPVLLE